LGNKNVFFTLNCINLHELAKERKHQCKNGKYCFLLLGILFFSILKLISKHKQLPFKDFGDKLSDKIVDNKKTIEIYKFYET
jgi:hypothetical protein